MKPGGTDGRSGGGGGGGVSGVGDSESGVDMLVMHQAAFRDDIERMRGLGHGWVKNMDARGRTPLHVAAAVGHLNSCKELILLGAQVEQKDDDGATALTLAKAYRHHHIVRYLEQQLAPHHASVPYSHGAAPSVHQIMTRSRTAAPLEQRGVGGGALQRNMLTASPRGTSSGTSRTNSPRAGLLSSPRKNQSYAQPQGAASTPTQRRLSPRKWMPNGSSGPDASSVGGASDSSSGGPTHRRGDDVALTDMHMNVQARYPAR